MSLSDRIKEARDNANGGAGMTSAELARATGRSQGAVSQWMDGTVTSLKAETAALIERATGYRSSWIVTGKGPKKVADAPEVQVTIEMALRILGAAIEAVEDESARSSATTMLGNFISSPRSNMDMLPLILKRLGQPVGAEPVESFTGTTTGFGYQKQTPVVPFNPAAKKSHKAAKGGEET